jgi:hypothetical protein
MWRSGVIDNDDRANIFATLQPIHRQSCCTTDRLIAVTGKMPLSYFRLHRHPIHKSCAVL